MKNLIFLAAFITSLSLHQGYSQTGFIHADGKKIVDGNNDDFLIRGMGIGSWMVKEPYMWSLYEDDDEGQHLIHENIVNVIGTSNFETFNKAWKENFFTKQDVQTLKSIGFNTIRVPMHYNLFTLPIEDEPVMGQDTWLDEGFAMLDTLLNWCEEIEVYAILDLHAAPGGQGFNGNINDYDPSKPSLWESDENKRKYLALWAKLAEKYADEHWIAAYDPMNEPNWSFIASYDPGDPSNANLSGGLKGGCNDLGNTPLRVMYDSLITTIRRYDTNHMIAIEGNCWGNNHNGLWPLPVSDNNVCLSFHKYWNDNNYASISDYISLRNLFNVPLWMSESGENDAQWYLDARELLEDNDIGWCWWTWKKMNNGTGAFTVKKPSGWDDLANYWHPYRFVSKPDTATAFNTLMDLTENIRVENVYENISTYTALLDEGSLHRDHTVVPARIEAEDAYQGMLTREDGCWDNDAWSHCGELAGHFSDGAWLSYKIDVPDAGQYVFTYRMSGYGSGIIDLKNESETTTYGTINSPYEGNWFNWGTVSHTVTLPSGEQTIVLDVRKSGFNLDWFEVDKLTSNTDDLHSSTISVFPNPGTGLYTIEGADIASITIVNELGQQVYHVAQSHTNLQQVDLSSLKPGIYSVRIFSTKGSLQTLKLMHN